MAFNNRRPGFSGRRDENRSSRGPDRRRVMYHRRKICRFCADSNLAIEYKDFKLLRLFTSERGKIVPRRISGNCAKHQRILTVALKRARNIALIPFSTAAV